MKSLKLIKTLTVICALAMMSTVCSAVCNAAFAAAEEEEHAVSVDLSGNGDGYSNVLYDNTNGLPTSEANAIAETSDGFIWIGSYSGLIRYDGNAFERYDSTTGIASVVSLFVDSQDRLWVGTNDSGVACIDQGDVRMYNRADGLLSLSIRAIAEDQEGNIYIGTTHGVAVITPDMELSVIDAPSINDQYIRGLTTGSDDIIYGVTMDGCVFTMADKALVNFYTGEDLMISNIHSVIPDEDNPGYVYIGTKQSFLWHGDLSARMRKATVVNVAPLEYLNSMEQGDGVLWVCADNGIGMIHGNDVVVLNNIPLNNAVEDVMKDYQGNLWFVSSKLGVMKIVPNQFKDIFSNYNLDPTVVNATCFYEDMLMIGTKNDGIIVLNANGVVRHLPITSAHTASGDELNETDLIAMLDGCKIRSIISDREGRIWISTYGDSSLIRFDHGRVVKFTVDDGLPSSRVRTVFERKDGSFMVACTGGLAIIRNDRVVKVYDHSSGIENPEILTCAEADNGDMLIGTDGDGIYIINDSTVRHLSIEDGLMSDVVMRIKRDASRDLYWIVTSNSIAYLDSDEHITTIQNFPYSNNFDMYENSLGDMWILSSNGIYVVPAEELIANGAIDPVFYGMPNGLPCITTANSYSAINEDGDLYMACTTGVAKVNIETPFESVNELKASVPYVDADGVRIYPDDDGVFQIPFSARKVTIHSFVFTYSLMNPQVTYYLDGFDATPTTVRRTELGPIDYTNLHGGIYKFVLKVSDAMGRGDNEITVTLVKEKSFYENAWFYLLILAFIAFVMWYIIRDRMDAKTKVLEEKARENMRLVGEIAEAFAKTIDLKDKYTNGHSQRVAEYTKLLTRELGYDEDTVEKYYNIALLHDIGKLGVDINVLNKNGKLNDSEFAQIKAHAAIGDNILKGISIMPEIAVGAGAHHERPDGKGYPKGLKGDEIPRVAQIIAVADTFDAMYSDRPYRKRMNFDKAVSIIKEVSGTQLTADVVDAFLRLVDQGEFRDPNDDGGGTTEDIDNIHKRLNQQKDNDKNDNNDDKDEGKA